MKADERSHRCGDRIPSSVYAPVSPDHHPERDPAQPDRHKRPFCRLALTSASHHQKEMND